MQEIIVYRNPGEAAMWEFLMNSPTVFPFMCAVIVGLVATSGLFRLVKSRRWRMSIDPRLPVIAGVLAGVATYYVMYI